MGFLKFLLFWPNMLEKVVILAIPVHVKSTKLSYKMSCLGYLLPLGSWNLLYSILARCFKNMVWDFLKLYWFCLNMVEKVEILAIPVHVKSTKCSYKNELFGISTTLRKLKFGIYSILVRCFKNMVWDFLKFYCFDPICWKK